MIDILIPLLITMSPNQMIQDMRNWEAEQNRTPAEESINRSLQEMEWEEDGSCLLYTSPSPRDRTRARMPSSA